jgi:hypothetical protein
MDYNPFKSYITEVKEIAYKALPAKERQKILAKCRVGEKIKLIHTPTLYHINAIKACRETGEQLGWLYGGISDEIAPQLDREAVVKTDILKITKGRIPFRRGYRCILKILIYTE